MQLDDISSFCKEVPPGLLAFAPVLWFAARRVAVMQLAVGLHFKKENNTKVCVFVFFFSFVCWPASGFSTFLLSRGLRMVSPLKLFESHLYNKLVPWAALSMMTISSSIMTIPWTSSTHPVTSRAQTPPSIPPRCPTYPASLTTPLVQMPHLPILTLQPNLPIPFPTKDFLAQPPSHCTEGPLSCQASTPFPPRALRLSCEHHQFPGGKAMSPGSAAAGLQHHQLSLEETGDFTVCRGQALTLSTARFFLCPFKLRVLRWSCGAGPSSALWAGGKTSSLGTNKVKDLCEHWGLLP